ncbi:LysR family transcriptional regulator [Sinorhizobium meliloti]|uniref:LysR substrate-binding domain-containing protein n=1 Tax=Rhizobium meliloti TaxID=382 RepID=UPI000B4985E3|nr:LysR substrate-binding domain-containing protein [Sinorhizobium meliloti]ASP73800.1 LysR family transcriptional regulator [Sinorhizobium meliloti]MCO5963696.1 LysR substrate-binding domain-containing protein [Sinorhizobium meliloti]MDE3858048.1 LysR family transcriptional regulator [Sinorhizobium meliloti]MDW9540007.1 LysR family transcriptional regulator [Sinorhizobium meliloti]MDW9596041.1 LysR family transcriptional regulator [Sinorhizobium meliloti]
MNFRQIEAFRAVIISGTVSRAAELMGVTQPNVSRLVGELEEAIGFALFDRVKGRLIPTPEGQAFYRDVDASFKGLDLLRSSAARIRDFGSGQIRVASLAAAGSTIVPRAVKRFRQSFPSAIVTLSIMTSASVRNHVVDGEYDLGLAADEVDLSGVEHQVFGSFPALCAIPAGHRLASKKVIRPEDFDGVDYVALSPEDRARLQFDRFCEQAGAKPNLVIETPFAITACALALEGVGIGIVNPLAIDGFAERGLIFRPFEPAVYFKSYLLFRPDMQKARLVRAFVSSLLAVRNVRSAVRVDV